MPWEVFSIGGSFGAVFLGTHLRHAHGWPVWQCILVGLGICGIALLLTHRFGHGTPTV